MYSFGETVCPELLRERQIFRALDAPSHRDDSLSLGQIDRLTSLLERRLRLFPYGGGIHVDVEPTHGSRCRASSRLVGAKCADLKADEMRRRPLRHDVGRELSLKHRPDEHQLFACALEGGDIGDAGACQTRRDLGREIARLIGMRQDDERWTQSFDHLLQGGGVAVRRVRLQRGVIGGNDFLNLCGGELCGDGVDAGPRDHHGDRLFTGELLSGGDGFPGGAIQAAAALFGNDEDQRTRASSRRRRTSSLAASGGLPPMICVFLPFCGTCNARIF